MTRNYGAPALPRAAVRQAPFARQARSGRPPWGGAARRASAHLDCIARLVAAPSVPPLRARPIGGTPVSRATPRPRPTPASAPAAQGRGLRAVAPRLVRAWGLPWRPRSASQRLRTSRLHNVPARIPLPKPAPGARHDGDSRRGIHRHRDRTEGVERD